MQDNFNLNSFLKENPLLNEAKLSKLDDNVASLLAYTYPSFDFDEEDERKFGKNTVARAKEIAPKVLAYKKKLAQLAKEIQNSEEGKILLAMISHSRGYGGSRNTSASVGDLFDF